MDLINYRAADLKELLDENFQNKKITKRDFNLISEITEFLKNSYFETEDVDGNIIKADTNTIKNLKKYYEDIVLLFYNNRDIISKNIVSNLSDNKFSDEVDI
jgi:hypothetical protein